MFIGLFIVFQNLLSQAKCDGNSRLDLFYYELAKSREISATFRKRLIEKCIHANPSEQLFWNSLKACC